MFKGKFIDIVKEKDGFLRGPFGSALKKSLFVAKSDDSYKVYEQGVVLEQNKDVGKYYISKEYYDSKMSRFETHEGDFLVSCSGVNYGAIYKLPEGSEQGVINQALLRIRLNNEIVDDNFFLYYFKAYIAKVITGGTGDSTIPNFPPMDFVKNIDIELPSKEIQIRIGNILKTIEEKIDNNNKINAELESMAKTIYDYWFLQFEFPNEEGKPYKSSGGKMVWNEELKREIPEGWKVGTLGEIATITMGSSPKGDSLNENNDGIVFYQGKTDFGDRFPTIRFYTSDPVKFAEENDVLLSVRAPVGSINIASEKCCIGRGLASIRSEYSSFIYYLLLCNQFQFDKYNNGGTTFGAITKEALHDIQVIIPKNEIFKGFNNNVKAHDEMIFNNSKQNKELSYLRAFLLPLLMNGQVGFKD